MTLLAAIVKVTQIYLFNYISKNMLKNININIPLIYASYSGSHPWSCIIVLEVLGLSLLLPNLYEEMINKLLQNLMSAQELLQTIEAGVLQN